MSPEDHEKRIKAVARALATSPPAILHYENYDEHHKDALFRLKARLALDAADKAVPMVTEAYHIAVRGEVLKQAAALTAAIRTNLERIIGNELPPSIWAEVDEFFDGLDSKYGKVIPRTRRKTTGQ